MASNYKEESLELPLKAVGWLNVWEVGSDYERRLFDHGRSPLPIWEPHFCVLTQDEKRFTHYRTEKAAEERPRLKQHKTLRLDGTKQQFDKRWGYEALECIKENVLQHSPLASLDTFTQRSQTLDNRTSASKDSSYEKGSSSSVGGVGLGERRGSVPVVSTIMDDAPVMEPPSTPSRIASFFSKRVKSNLKRTKSVTKLDRKRTPYNNDLEGCDLSSACSTPSGGGSPKFMHSLKRTMSVGRLARKFSSSGRSNSAQARVGVGAGGLSETEIGLLINNRMRTSRSHESLLMSPSSMHSIDLSGPDVEIKPLHSSMLGQDHCFQVSTANGSKFYSCRSAEEREKWIQHLRKTVTPKQEMSMRTDNSIELWVLEAKKVPSKKRYFCELCLDEALYSRTSSKTKGDLLFWGEHFDFNNLPATQKITVKLYREADKKKKKERNVLLGYVNIPAGDVTQRHLVEKWYTASAPTVGKAGKENKTDLPQIRIKAKYQSVKILPLEHYKDLIDYVERDYSILVEVLEPLISVKAKEELASCLVHILHKNGQGKDFLTDIVMAEVDKLENDNLAFRGNSIATKSMEAFLKLVGEKYLQDTLADFIRQLLDEAADCEVDPQKVGGNLTTLTRHRESLITYCEMAWFKIINSQCFFPSELIEVFSSFREACDERKRPELADNLISACIFLRFLCPAILSPSLFNLTQEFPQERAARNFTLIAKVVQSLANFTKFGAKEEFMGFLNDFVEREMISMKSFLQQISKVEPKNDRQLEFDGYIDLGRELSVLHTVLCESLAKMNDSTNSKLAGLHSILQGITDALEQPSPQTPSRMMHCNGHADPNANSGGVAIVSNLMKDYSDSSSLNSSLNVNEMSMYNSSRTVIRGFDNPHRNGSITSIPSQHQLQQQQQQQQTSPTHATDDYVLYTSVEPSLPDHLQDDRLAPSQSTPSMKRPDEKIINQSWEKIVSAADMVNGEYVDLLSFMDQSSHEGNSSVEIDNGDQMSVGQLSTVASSGYQSFAGGYSQSSSPIEHDGVSTSTAASNQQPLSFANPLFGHINAQKPSSLRQRSPSSSSLSDSDSLRHVGGGSKSPHMGNGGVGSQRQQQHGKPPVRNMSCSSTSSSESLPRNQHHPRQQQPSYAASSPNIPPANKSSSPPLSLPRSSELSRSVELRPPHGANGSPVTNNGMKRTVTDTGISSNCSPQQPPNDPSVYGSLRGQSSGLAKGNPVRMGVRSMQRKLKEQDKTKTEYEQELNDLRLKLGETQRVLSETQNRLMSEAEERDRQVEEYRGQAGEDAGNDEELIADQQRKQDEQMQQILRRSLSKLMSTEERLRQEQIKQQELPTILSEKQRIIDQQEQTIQSLNQANNRLLEALNHLKERYHKNPPPNGHVQSQAPTKHLELAADTNGQYRSSNC